MYSASSIVWLLAIGGHLASAASQIPVNLFADNSCKLASTITPNATATLDSCIVTVGLQSFNFPSTPCAGGTASTVQYFAFDDQRCSTKAYYIISYGNNCYGHTKEGTAIGSILMSCNTSPKADGTFTTVTVAPVASGSAPTATSVSGSSGGSSSSSTTSSTSSSSNNSNCSGFSCLPYAARIAIILSLSIGVPAIAWSGYRRVTTRRRLANLEAQHGTPQQAEIYPVVVADSNWGKQSQPTTTPLQNNNVINIYNQTSPPPPGPQSPPPSLPPNPIQPVNDNSNYPPPPRYTQ